MLRATLTGLINILYPEQCLVCKKLFKQEIIVCRDCLNSIKINVPPFCRRCGRNLKEDNCPYCRNTRLYFDRAFSPCRYVGTNAELIHLLKYKGKIKISGILTKILIKFIVGFHIAMDKIEVIVPVPLSSSKLREREFNQSELISLPIAEKFRIRHSAGNLIRLSNNKAQAKLKAQPRFKNIQGAFAVKYKDDFCGQNVLLIDDVLTTGATCSEAARILKESGAKSVSVLTFAS